MNCDDNKLQSLLQDFSIPLSDCNQEEIYLAYSNLGVAELVLFFCFQIHIHALFLQQ